MHCEHLWTSPAVLCASHCGLWTTIRGPARDRTPPHSTSLSTISQQPNKPLATVQAQASPSSCSCYLATIFFLFSSNLRRTSNTIDRNGKVIKRITTKTTALGPQFFSNIFLTSMIRPMMISSDISAACGTVRKVRRHAVTKVREWNPHVWKLGSRTSWHARLVHWERIFDGI